MALTLSTVAAGDPVNVVAMKAAIQSIEHFVNEEITATQLQTSAPWLDSLMVVKPAFDGGPNSGRSAAMQAVSAEIHYFSVGDADYQRSVHHSVVATTAAHQVPVAGMSRTFTTTEVITSGTVPKLAHVLASWYSFEFGGDGVMDDNTSKCAGFFLFVNGASVDATVRSLYTCSRAGDPGQLHCRRQHSLYYPASITSAGVHNISLRIRPALMTTGNGSKAGNDDWRHIFVGNRQMHVEVPYR